MKHPLLMLFALALLAIVGGSYYYINYIAYPTYHFHFKVSAEVQTPGGLKIASVVNEDVYKYLFVDQLVGRSQSTAMDRGEALFLDLGNGKNLTIANYADDTRQSEGQDGNGRSEDLGTLPLSAFELSSSKHREFEAALGKARNLPPVAIPLGWLPTLLTFSDVTDYKSMRRVDPQHLDAALGDGYAIKRVTVEITDAPITDQIEGKLPWLVNFKNIGTAFDGTNYPAANSPILSKIYFGHFKLDR